MKEIKIRAWDKNKKVMIYPPSSIESRLGPQMTLDGRVYMSVPSGIPGMGAYEYQDWIMLPWVGLLDKNAEEIYEGDILGGTYEGGWIEYCEDCKAFQYHASDECFACMGDVHWYELVEDDRKLEVIGNIYENPNLKV